MKGVPASREEGQKMKTEDQVLGKIVGGDGYCVIEYGDPDPVTGDPQRVQTHSLVKQGKVHKALAKCGECKGKRWIERYHPWFEGSAKVDCPACTPIWEELE
jgi:hypothetical protein